MSLIEHVYSIYNDRASVHEGQANHDLVIYLVYERTQKSRLTSPSLKQRPNDLTHDSLASARNFRTHGARCNSRACKRRRLRDRRSRGLM